MAKIDLHQHLWGESFIEELGSRSRAPRLDGWTLYLDGEPPYDIDPREHDPVARAALARRDGLDRVLISLSAPLGIEWLPVAEANRLLDAYHDDTLALPEPFAAWAAAHVGEVDPARLARDLDRGCAGLQLPATALLDRAGYEHCAPLLRLLAERDLPLFVHPGAAAAAAGVSTVPVTPAGVAASAYGGADGVPGWWPALVPYVQQLHAAWFAFRAYGRPAHPRLKVCFAALAGLAPLHGERFTARGGGRGRVDPLVFVETSSYGPNAVDWAVRALGVDAVAYGSDRPYAGPPEPADFGLGEAAQQALYVGNPRRLLSDTFKKE